MTFIKICGITNIDDARAAVAAGADALGFNFYNRSPRYIAPPAAREIVEQLPSSILTVGVFVNEETPESVKKIASEAGVTAFQLHGDESPAYCRELSDRYVIKTLTVSGDFDIQMVSITTSTPSCSTRETTTCEVEQVECLTGRLQ